MIDDYKIKSAYKDTGLTDCGEIEIISENLLYSEILSLSGLQCSNIKNADIIRSKCNQISNLIKEIDKLNKEL